MLLSIVIPVYNVEKYLAECLDSVFSQDLSECEIICVNDGATDKSSDILKSYQNCYSQLIVLTQSNKGLSAARNAGMAVASGEFIYFIDSDDYLLRYSVKNIIDSIKSNKENEVVMFNAKINDDKLYISSFDFEKKDIHGVQFLKNYYDINRCYPPFNVWLYVYKKLFLKKFELHFLDNYFHEDIHFTLLVLYYAKNISFYDTPIYSYRLQGQNSISTNVRLKNLSDKSNIHRLLNTIYKNNNFKDIYFYNCLFYSYLFTLIQGVEHKYISSKKEYFNNDDKKIMRKGITNDYEFKLWALALISHTLMYKYYSNQMHQFSRRLFNIIFGMLFKIYKLKAI